MLLSLTPEAPLPTILFTLTFPSPLPDPLPLPVAWDSHLQIVNNLQLSSPPDVHALDRSAAWVSLIDTVNFDLGTLILTCTFIDQSKEEWPLSSSCVILLEKIISDVNRSAREAEAEAEDCHNTSVGSSLNFISAPIGSGHVQKQPPSESAFTSTSSLSSSATIGNGSATTTDGNVVTVKSPKPKKRRSILAALVASLVPLPMSRSATPASTRPSSPNGQLPGSPSDSNSLKGSITTSPSLSCQHVQPQPETITPPPGVPLSRFLRRRARSTLVDAFRRFVLPELSMRYRSELAKTNPQVTLPFGGPFYALWATRSMMRSVVAEMGRVLMNSNKGSDAVSSSSASSPLETPIGGLGDPLDDCTTTDESSVHSISEQTNSSFGGAIPKASSLISLRLRRKVNVNPELSQESYDTYTNLRETYARLRNLSSQLEAHVQAENHVECVGSKPGSEAGVDETVFTDFFDPACSSPDKLSFLSEPCTQQLQEQLTSAEIKSRRRAWSTRTYLVSGWETYHNSLPRRPLPSHKRSYSEPASSVLRGGSPMNLIGLSMPARPSPLSQAWVHELEENAGAYDHDNIDDEGMYVGSAGRGMSKWSWSFEIGRRQRVEGFPRARSSLPMSGHGHERCGSVIASSLKAGSVTTGRKIRSKLRPKIRRGGSFSRGHQTDYTGVGSGYRNARFPEDVNANDNDEDDEEEKEEGEEGTFDDNCGIDVGIHEVDFRAVASENNETYFTDRVKLTSTFGLHEATQQRVISSRSPMSNHYPMSSNGDDGGDEVDFDFHSYRSSSRALKHFRYGYGVELYSTDNFQEDVYGSDNGSDAGFDYGYSRPDCPTDGVNNTAVEYGLYKKPSLEEFILPHPRSRVNSGLDVGHVPLVDDVAI